MRKRWAFILLAVVGAALTALFVARLAPGSSNASSHREAPLISEDPTADNTDLYAFRSPDKPNTLTIVANWIPGEDPAAGPNYYTFSQSAKYNIHIDRNGDGKPDITYSFRFKTPTGPYFLGNTQQTWQMWRNNRGFANGKTPINNIGPRTTPNYHALAANAVAPLAGGGQVFAGQRDDPFFGDVGDIFDLGTLGPFEPAHLIPGSAEPGEDYVAEKNVHTIALQIPISQLDTPSHTIGVWSAADRLQTAVERKDDLRKSNRNDRRASWVQVSRLGNPLINEVVIPTTLKDKWNRLDPSQDRQFVKYYRTPILAAVINKLYNLGVPETNRDDLVQVLLTGIPNVTFTGSTPADELRINLATPLTPAGKVSRLGVLGGDVQGFPNGRRLGDDVIDIEEQAVGGFLVGHKLPLGDGVDDGDTQAMATFPYVADPQSGADDTHGEQK